MVPYDMQRPSFRIAVRQGSCSSIRSDGLLAALGIAAPNSMHIIHKIGGFFEDVVRRHIKHMCRGQSACPNKTFGGG